MGLKDTATEKKDPKRGDQKHRNAPYYSDVSPTSSYPSCHPSNKERTVVLLYHKPGNVITSHSNADAVSCSATSNRRTVYEDIYSMEGFVSSRTNISFEEATGVHSKLHAIGRLDADTTGLLLLTNDGGLVHWITNPTSKQDSDPIPKTYEAVIMGHHSLPQRDGPFTNNDNNTYPLMTLIQNGALLPQKYGGHTRPVDRLSVLSHPTRSTTRVSITISEGKNRQIRRMFHAIGSGVMKLHRVSVGDLTLSGLMPLEERIQRETSDVARDELKEGEWRVLHEEEVLKGLGWKCRHLVDEHDRNTNQRSQSSVGNQKRRRRRRGS